MTMRVARAFTGRDLVAKFHGATHGNANDGLFVDGGLVEGGDMIPVPVPAGLPQSVVDGVLVLPFNDIENTVRLIREHGPRLAAVITEPVLMKFPGGRSTDPEFLRALRQVTEEQGVLLVFDEMVTGFRLGLGGGAGYFGVRPDLVAMGKVIGGGMPIGAYGGRADVMNRTVAGADHTPVIRQSGTHSAHPLSAAAGLAQVRELERLDPYPDLRARGERLRSGLAAACVASGIDAQVMGLESIFVMRFRSAAEQLEFCLGLMAEGAFWAPGLAGYLSAAHTDEDIEAVIEAAGRVLAGMVAAAA
jgi:glutamate-1-semialdehyde 2,1-aminomutase